MKYLLLLVLLAGFFFVMGLKRSRPRDPEVRKPPPQPPKPAQPQAMLRCAECGMHLPAEEALPGKGGVFCGAPHRNSFEARQGQA
jgi:uncharacterized protein